MELPEEDLEALNAVKKKRPQEACPEAALRKRPLATRIGLAKRSPRSLNQFDGLRSLAQAEAAALTAGAPRP
jgi:hypothetical protein